MSEDPAIRNKRHYTGANGTATKKRGEGDQTERMKGSSS